MLRDLLSEIPEPTSVNVSDASVGETTVTAVTYDSRQAGPGSVFVALRGVHADGASFAREMGMFLLALGVALGLAAWVQVELGLWPLRRVRRELAAMARNPAQRLSEDHPKEIDALAQAINALASIARDKGKSEKVRNNAVFWIGQSRVPNRVGMLEDVYKNSMDNSKIRQQVMFALGQTREPQAVTIMGNVALSDPDIEVRKQAVFWLGQNRSPEANQALERLLQKK